MLFVSVLATEVYPFVLYPNSNGVYYDGIVPDGEYSFQIVTDGSFVVKCDDLVSLNFTETDTGALVAKFTCFFYLYDSSGVELLESADLSFIAYIIEEQTFMILTTGNLGAFSFITQFNLVSVSDAESTFISTTSLVLDVLLVWIGTVVQALIYDSLSPLLIAFVLPVAVSIVFWGIRVICKVGKL